MHVSMIGHLDGLVVPDVTSFSAVDKKVLKEIRFLVTIGVTTTKANTPIVFNPKRLLGPLPFYGTVVHRIASLSFSQKVCG